MTISFRLNNEEQETTVSPATPLLYVLRNDFELNGPRFGCGTGQCGACTVLVDGAPARSCLLQLSMIDGKEVKTLEALGSAAKPHVLQASFIAEQALQCGYCGNGVLMAAAALLERNPSPTEAEVRRALQGYLCRCGAHGRIVKAVMRAARALE